MSENKKTNQVDILNIQPRNEQEYLDMRVVDQITWYDNKSKKNKDVYLFLKVSEIILALLIPFLSAYIDGSTGWLRLLVGSIGIAVAAIAGIITLVKYQENWIEYRTITESLKFEKFLFLARSGPYVSEEKRFELFVERFEGLISNSNKKWINYISTVENPLKAKISS